MLNITSGGMSGGYQTYLSNLIPRLAAHPQVQALLVGMPESADISAWQKPAPSVEWLPLGCTLLSRGREVSRSARRTVAEFSPDVVFIPTTRHFTLDGIPLVNMARNMMPATLHHTAYGAEWVRNWARLKQMRRALNRSNRVIAISQFVQDYLTNTLGLPPDRVGVVYHGIDPEHTRHMQQPGGIPNSGADRFVFTAGLIYPYRGLEDLINAWSHLRDWSDLPTLVVAGKIGQGMSRYYAKLRRLVRQQSLDSRIRFTGVLNRSEMAWCYNNCLAFVMTSRVEACPNIALEAMAAGCVCIATTNPPLPEILADAAQYYPAGEALQLAQKVREMAGLSNDRREQIKCRARARASQFSWDTCCNRTVAELHKAIQ